MHQIITFNNITPNIDKDAYISNNCIIVGDVVIGKNSSIWFNSVLRGDVNPIRVGNNTNIQDGTIIHTSRFDGPTEIGSNITIGHRVMLHACTILDFAFIGMSATILDRAIVEEYGFVAAGALLTPEKVVKSKQLWAGVPAKFVRTITDIELKHMQENYQHYVKLAAKYRQQS
ncbi:MAG: gamma carbonic anhydrase family protein [Janthinobacterium lividum]